MQVPTRKGCVGARGLLARYCRDPATVRSGARERGAQENARSLRSGWSIKKDAGLKTGGYESKPEKNPTVEIQGCGTRVVGAPSPLCLDLKT